MFPLSQVRSASGAAVAAVVLAAAGGLAGVNAASAQAASSCACQVPVGASGVVESAAGNVFVTQAGGSSPAQPAMRLVAGDAVLVGPQSSSVVNFGGGCTLRLSANTTFEVLPQGEQLCLAVNQNAAEAGAVAEGGVGGSVMSAPAGIAAGIGLGAVVLSVSDKDKSVSR
ncbi:hypothetical protein [Aquamicrobium defluvii]|nr:hypothetical protein [Aquamicrobium defluvii]